MRATRCPRRKPGDHHASIGPHRIRELRSERSASRTARPSFAVGRIDVLVVAVSARLTAVLAVGEDAGLRIPGREARRGTRDPTGLVAGELRRGTCGRSHRGHEDLESVGKLASVCHRELGDRVPYGDHVGLGLLPRGERELLEDVRHDQGREEAEGKEYGDRAGRRDDDPESDTSRAAGLRGLDRRRCDLAQRTSVADWDAAWKTLFRRIHERPRQRARGPATAPGLPPSPAGRRVPARCPDRRARLARRTRSSSSSRPRRSSPGGSRSVPESSPPPTSRRCSLAETSWPTSRRSSAARRGRASAAASTRPASC